jgi:hypothetical protein
MNVIIWKVLYIKSYLLLCIGLSLNTDNDDMKEFTWPMIELQTLFLRTIMAEIHHADPLRVYYIDSTYTERLVSRRPYFFTSEKC